MRRILVDMARAKSYQKRGGGAHRSSARRRVEVAADAPGPTWWRCTTRSTPLAAVDARKSQVVELRFFGGLSVEETR